MTKLKTTLLAMILMAGVFVLVLVQEWRDREKDKNLLEAARRDTPLERICARSNPSASTGIFFGRQSLERSLKEFVAHFHQERNHQGLRNRIINGGAFVLGKARATPKRRNWSGVEVRRGLSTAVSVRHTQSGFCGNIPSHRSSSYWLTATQLIICGYPALDGRSPPYASDSARKNPRPVRW